jgi:hypothetical protein
MKLKDILVQELALLEFVNLKEPDVQLKEVMRFLYTSLILTEVLIEELQELLRITGKEARAELLTGTIIQIVKL